MSKLIPVNTRVLASYDTHSEPVEATLLQSVYLCNWALCKLPDGSKELLQVVDVVIDGGVECEG